MTRTMGPIERALRMCPHDNNQAMNWVWSGDTSDLAFDEVVSACVRLGIPPEPYGYTNTAHRIRALPDVLSEAIECAEALGL